MDSVRRPEAGSLPGLEEVATAITSFTTFHLPALLQTEEYTREVIKKVAPKMDPDIYRQRVEVRMRRQEVLKKKDRPRYRVLLDESVLRRPVGGPALMVAQIDKILQAEHEGKATIHIIPFNFGVPAAQDSISSFWNLTIRQRYRQWCLSKA